MFHYRFDLKKSVISFLHSSSSTPLTTSHFGCIALGANLAKPRFSSVAPYTTRRTCAQPMAPAHIMQGSTVTYRVQSVRYLPPSVLAADVMACISA